MTATRYLIANADDFGQSHGVNQGIIEAYERGIVTSASLMVRWPAAAEAVAYSRQHADMSLGLHVDLGEWAYRDGTWICLYEVIPSYAMQVVTNEVYRQLEMFIRLVGKKPTHMDSHQHRHQHEPIRTVLIKVAQALEIPLRNNSAAVHYCGAFYGQTPQGISMPEAISVKGLIRTLATLSHGLTELGCHPGYGYDIDTMYRSERAEEVKVLCNLRIRTCIETMEIELCSFQDFPRYWPVSSSGRSIYRGL